ncbi:MAG: hypothetical protein AVDCRST_MAG41-3333 [uncultured Corynebacteriales bacterium]|uniref:DUF2029 domain-containing protein n=1 Tax=uncultured Mycobacteriales bacterium TaxID=581187 RepID=A0A6J4JII7_9ACTN|nr:MAG: hypothetical protein AVDCRST_MAG41-3333 [uncultured Corynebacteriales bacterium]
MGGNDARVRDNSARRVRWTVFAVAVLAGILKLVLASRTYGTNDVGHWIRFTAGVHDRGPIGVYEGSYKAVYNHPPLIGWWLAAVDGLSAYLPVRFLVKIPAVLADVACAVLVAELLRIRRGRRAAVSAGVLVAISPVLIAVSGFHGNTDPVFVLLVLAAGWLLVDRRLPVAAGVVAALALSVKIVPVVALPVLLVAAWRGRLGPLRFLAGAAAVFALLWVPVLTRQWPAFQRNVIGYRGTAPEDSQWGLPQILRAAGADAGAINALNGSGRFVILALCALLPVALVWRRPAAAPLGAALSLVLFLLLSPAWGTQYTAWGLAPAYLLSGWAATGYSALAGALLVQTYTRWSGGFPWYEARASGLDLTGQRLGLLAWCALLAAAALGVRRILTTPSPHQETVPCPPSPDPDPGSASSSSPTTPPRRWRPRSTASPRTSAPA